jgi:hypothetical protein
MQKNGSLHLGQLSFRFRFVNLLIFILALIAIQPFGEAIHKLSLFVQIITSVILISAIYAVGQRIRHTVIGILLAVPLLITMWAKHLLEIRWLQIPESVIGITFFGFIITLILKFILSRDEIKADMIAGAAAVYLLLAITWAYAYSLIAIVVPGSFAMAETQNITRSIAIYYSFVTITTLGYGDIFPVTTAAKSCAVLEAVVGQLYLVITVAWLVGVHVSQKLTEKSPSKKSGNRG